VTDVGAVHRYHDGTKHHFNRFARSLGFLDWASQPAPFRSFAGSPVTALAPRPDATGDPAIGTLLRCSLGLSAWKAVRGARWSLRVNPSSGNLHPTEAYLVARSSPAPGATGGVFHYAPDRHVLERRSAFDADALGGAILVALTSVHWREAWKYGERAFRYCQHDLGHAVAAVRFAAALVGRRAHLVPEWTHRQIARLTGVDRDEDYVEAEREEPGCLVQIESTTDPADGPRTIDPDPLLAACASGRWTGRASQLSEDHVEWTFIDEIARATEDCGRDAVRAPSRGAPGDLRYPFPIVLRRRSALALDGRSSIPAARFFEMIAPLRPSGQPPWDALWWTPRVHLAIFVHRVDGLESGLYLLPRSRDPDLARDVERLRQAMRADFLWEPVSALPPLVCLARGDCRALAARLACDQAIAADGFFSLAMIADFDASLRDYGAAFYRHLFWESGVVGQVLYLESERAGARGTGIGCFYDDPVHDLLGLRDHAFQSLYHFAAGVPVDDARLTTEPGYEWEAAGSDG
jgi:SagB-type dehydrogenase family enzyme